MTTSFTATFFGAPVSKNRGRGQGFGHSFVPAVVREFQQGIRAAVRAAVPADWIAPDPFQIEHLKISIYKYNTKADADAGSTYIFDALQYQNLRTKKLKEADHWGLVSNDKFLSIGECPRPVWDSGGQRIVLKFELLCLASTLEAFALRERWVVAENKRKDKRKEKARLARIAKKDASK